MGSDYKLEVSPKQTNIAGRPFTFYAYQSPVAQLHWYVLATEIRCHAVEFVLTSRDTKLLESLLADMPREVQAMNARAARTDDRLRRLEDAGR